MSAPHHSARGAEPRAPLARSVGHDRRARLDEVIRRLRESDPASARSLRRPDAAKGR